MDEEEECFMNKDRAWIRYSKTITARVGATGAISLKIWFKQTLYALFNLDVFMQWSFVSELRKDRSLEKIPSASSSLFSLCALLPILTSKATSVLRIVWNPILRGDPGDSQSLSSHVSCVLCPTNFVLLANRDRIVQS